MTGHAVGRLFRPLEGDEVMQATCRIGAAVLVSLVALSGCSIKRLAVDKVGDALSGGGAVWESDDDLELVGEALPFSLKLVSESPRHRGLLETACKGFATYAYVYVQPDLEAAESEELARARLLRERARRLYLRAHRYGLRGLDAAHAGLSERLAADPRSALAPVRRDEVSLLYWNAVALGLAISVSADDAGMIARLPEVDAMLGRAIELDEAWNEGALHEIEITLAATRPGGADAETMRRHFERAVELAEGRRAGPFVGYAEAAAVPRQDAAEFRALLARALAVDPDAHEPARLANLVAQRRARFLLAHVEDLFLDPSAGADSGSEVGDDR
jgi:predicted anti-sigma-YlaC factor YlaD